MFDPSRLKTPPNHGDVLIAPPPTEWTALARSNADRLSRCATQCGSSTIGEWRARTRRRFVGNFDGPLICVGHQPEFIHAGVWAKQVAADRFARAIGGRAIHLVVDSDSPRKTELRIPIISNGHAIMNAIRLPAPLPGHPYEGQRALKRPEIIRLRDHTASLMGGRFDTSMMPAFFAGLQGASDARDRVDQMIAGRREAERFTEPSIDDIRVGGVWWSPLLVHLLVEAERFAGDYNRALARYRKTFGVRGANRPIPDLVHVGDRVETPIWGYREGERRRRVYVARRGESLDVSADGESVLSTTIEELSSTPDAVAQVCETTGWRLRPRALALTLWARLFLSDLFIHGIGGTKYDRITDWIMVDHFGVEPPAMACVSATLEAIPGWQGNAAASVEELRRRIRDGKWNPQRLSGMEDALAGWSVARNEAIRRSESLRQNDPRNHPARREVFLEIRALNQKALTTAAGRMEMLEQQLRQVAAKSEESRIARDRDCFFALHDRRELERLVAALRAAGDFRV